MARRVVVGYDGSECAKAALDQALDLAAPNGSVFITYANAPPAVGSSSLVPPEKVRELGKRVTAEAMAIAEGRGVPT